MWKLKVWDAYTTAGGCVVVLMSRTIPCEDYDLSPARCPEMSRNKPYSPLKKGRTETEERRRKFY